MKKRKKSSITRKILKDAVKNFQSETDILGSYTGLPTKDKTPVQDADDL